MFPYFHHFAAVIFNDVLLNRNDAGLRQNLRYLAQDLGIIPVDDWAPSTD